MLKLTVARPYPQYSIVSWLFIVLAMHLKVHSNPIEVFVRKIPFFQILNERKKQRLIEGCSVCDL